MIAVNVEHKEVNIVLRRDEWELEECNVEGCNQTHYIYRVKVKYLEANDACLVDLNSTNEELINVIWNRMHDVSLEDGFVVFRVSFMPYYDIPLKIIHLWKCD